MDNFVLFPEPPDFLCSIKSGLGLGLGFSGFFSAGVLSDMSLINVSLSTGATYTSVTEIPAGSIVWLAMLNVTTAYPPGTTIEFGTLGSLAAFMTSDQNIPDKIGLYVIGECTTVASLASLVGTIGGSPAYGQANMLILYSLPLP